MQDEFTEALLQRLDGLTLEAAAARLRTSVATMSRLRNGKTAIGIKVLREALRLYPDLLYLLHEQPKPQRRRQRGAA